MSQSPAGSALSSDMTTLSPAQVAQGVLLRQVESLSKAIHDRKQGRAKVRKQRHHKQLGAPIVAEPASLLSGASPSGAPPHSPLRGTLLEAGGIKTPFASPPPRPDGSEGTSATPPSPGAGSSDFMPMPPGFADGGMMGTIFEGNSLESEASHQQGPKPAGPLASVPLSTALKLLKMADASSSSSPAVVGPVAEADGDQLSSTEWDSLRVFQIMAAQRSGMGPSVTALGDQRKGIAAVREVAAGADVNPGGQVLSQPC